MGARFSEDAVHYVFSRRPPPASVPAGVNFVTESIDALLSVLSSAGSMQAQHTAGNEFQETVEALWSLPFRQPIEIAIGSSHVAVRARRNIDDDFSMWHDTPMSVSS
jgi:hypothetical protein